MNVTALAAIVLVSIGTLRIVSTYHVFNHVIDEPDQLAAGVEFLSTGKYLYEDEHPPLARVFGALGPFLAGERWRKGPNSYFEGYRILGFGAHYDRILTLGRAGILPFFWIASLVVYRWGHRTAGPVAALVGTLLFTTTPPILAHSGLITTDMALACWTGAAALASLYWADQPDRKRSMAFGATLALACLSKFTALLFLPVVWLGMCLAGSRLRQAFRDPRAIGVVLATAFLAIWAAYAFSFARVEFLHLRLPAARFFSGIHSLWTHNRLGHSSYLLGRRSPNGFWYYYPVVLAVKTPLGMLGLLLAAPWFLSRKTALPAAYCAAILACSMLGRVNIGVRLILPIYVGFAVVGGCVAAAAQGRLARVAVAGLLGWVVISGALQHPDYLAYFNEIGGSRPERILADSDLDWGQDMKRLGDFLAQAGATQVAFSPFNRTYTLAGHAFPTMTPSDPDHPSPGWNAVSITIWKVFGFPAWADRMAPERRIGRSILLWYVPGVN